MKILLLGEFSSLHKYLKEGLLELGYSQVEIAAEINGWKQIGGIDLPIASLNKKTILEVAKKGISDYEVTKKLIDYDVVQMVNTKVFSLTVNEMLFKRIRKNNNILSLVSAGEDYPLIRAYLNNSFSHYGYDDNKEPLKNFDGNSIKGRIRVKNDEYIEANVDVIIPSLYEYGKGYSSEKVISPIPFPINLKNINYQENIVKNKIVFFHGINVEWFKGTSYIREALMRLKDKYPDDVEVIINSRMPFNEYVKAMEKTNVVIDQCMSYGYGINSCLAMGQGKVVLCGVEKETLDAFGLSSSPIIPIKPNADIIFEKLCEIVENKRSITEIGFHSRKYVEEVHDHIEIAQRYVDAWKSTGKI